ncbi:hypothetical protein KM043_003093 [Ampulex compressa]|nr:hypothetical protein KM043_003093 [Ampulex compressa]
MGRGGSKIGVGFFALVDTRERPRTREEHAGRPIVRATVAVPEIPFFEYFHSSDYRPPYPGLFPGVVHGSVDTASMRRRRPSEPLPDRAILVPSRRQRGSPFGADKGSPPSSSTAQREGRLGIVLEEGTCTFSGSETLWRTERKAK